METFSSEDAERRVAELEKLRAEIAKLAAERLKLEREYEQLRKTTWERAGELIKISGAIIAIVIGGLTAITTPQLVKLQTEIARRDKDVAEKDRVAAESTAVKAKRDAAIAAQDLAKVNRDLLRAKREAENATRDVGFQLALRSQISRERDAAQKELSNIRALVSQLRTDDPAVERLKEEARLEVPLPTLQPFLFIISSDAETDETAKRAAAEFNAEYKVHIRLSEQQDAFPNTKWTDPIADLRYFRDDDRNEAAQIRDRLQQLTKLEVKLSQSSDPDARQARYFELRFSCTCITIVVE